MAWIGLFYLLKIFYERACIDPNPDVDIFSTRFLPKPNDFSDLVEYFVQKALIEALSRIRQSNGLAFSQIQQLFIDQLSYADNSLNPVRARYLCCSRTQYSDSIYIAWLLQALSNSFVDVQLTQDEIERGQPRQLPQENVTTYNSALDAVDQMLHVDRLVPSYRNTLAISCLQFYVKLMLSSFTPIDFALFLPFTREGTYSPIRTVAFDCLLLLGGLQDERLAQYMLAVLRYDESPLVRQHLGSSILTSLVTLIATDAFGEKISTDTRGRSAFVDVSLEEFDENFALMSAGTRSRGGGVAVFDSQAATIDRAFKTLRSRIGSNAAVREALQATITCVVELSVPL